MGNVIYLHGLRMLSAGLFVIDRRGIVCLDFEYINDRNVGGFT